ncbi:BlaI/MecI/CopY family transcriptional regulator [Actinoplanes sp. NPDC051633]|uniref:BlaI/MecI/CopY family transcriptional regulator n=1 Tax=Actinoplanes sp. NPDC051633 TaxID=3155670 RepID=UPI003436560D
MVRGRGDLERSIMDVLWSADGPMAGRAVVEAFWDDAPAYSTIVTALDRLTRKGVVIREMQGRVGVYRAAADSRLCRCDGAARRRHQPDRTGARIGHHRCGSTAVARSGASCRGRRLWATVGGVAVHLGCVAARGVAAGRFPLGNIYEFVISARRPAQ